MTDLANLAYIVLSCVALGGFVPLMFQPLLGWSGALRWAGWGSVLVLVAAVVVYA